MRPKLTLVPDCGEWLMRRSRPALAEQRPQMVVQKLDAVHGRVRNVPRRKAFEPVVFDLPVRSEGDVAKAVTTISRRSEKGVGLFKEGHAAILGNVFPKSQGTLSPGDGKAFPVVKKRPIPRQTLAKNLRALCNKFEFSGHEVARRARVDPKTVNNQLNAKYDPRPDQVDAVAAVFGLNYWDLLNPHFDPEAASSDIVRQLTALYSQADDKGRRNIMAVAEMAADYRHDDGAAEQQPQAVPASKAK